MRTRQKLLSAGLLAVLAFSFIGVFVSVSAVSPPLVFNSNATTGINQSLMLMGLHVDANNAIVVEEWIGPGLGGNTATCSNILGAADSFGNSFSAVGSCLADNNGAAMEAFSATNGATTGNDVINCLYSSNTVVEACYAFNISSPGTISSLATGVGIGNLYNTTTASASAGSLLLITAGIQYHCAQVLAASFTGFIQYSQNTACSVANSGLFQYGMAGGLVNVGLSGLTNNFQISAGSANVIWGEMVIQVAQQAATTTFTSTVTDYTATVTGWLMPDSAHFSNTYILIILPLAGMVFCLIPFMMFAKPREIGDKAIFPALFGLMVGSAVGDISVNPNTPLTIPFADTFVAGFLLFMWWWNS